MSEQHDAQSEYGASPKTLSSYLTGFILCVLLTLLAFASVQWKWLSGGPLFAALSSLAIAQLIVQSLCFLRLNSSPEGRWNLFPFLFTALIISILVGGSLWIMYNLNYNML